MPLFDLRSKGSRKPVSWENGKLRITCNFPDAWHDIESHLIGRRVDMTSNWAPIALCMNPFIHQASHYHAVRTPHSAFYNQKTAGNSLLLVPGRPLTLRQFAHSCPVLSHYSSSSNPNPPPKSMVSQISMIGSGTRLEPSSVMSSTSSTPVLPWRWKDALLASDACSKTQMMSGSLG